MKITLLLYQRPLGKACSFRVPHLIQVGPKCIFWCRPVSVQYYIFLAVRRGHISERLFKISNCGNCYSSAYCGTLNVALLIIFMFSFSLQSIGKGSLWCIDPEYRQNLIQALKKTPYHPYSHVFNTPPASPQAYQR